MSEPITEEDLAYWEIFYAVLVPANSPTWDKLTDDARMVFVALMIDQAAPVLGQVVGATLRAERAFRAEMN